MVSNSGPEFRIPSGWPTIHPQSSAVLVRFPGKGRVVDHPGPSHGGMNHHNAPLLHQGFHAPEFVFMAEHARVRV